MDMMQKNKIKEITDMINNGIKSVYESEKYKTYLKIMGRFYNYSYLNCILIMSQKPNATLVAGFKSQEKNFQRTIKKGELGIKILAPSFYKLDQKIPQLDPETGKPMTDENGNELIEKKQIEIPSFKIVHVFDISQTVGKELPKLCEELDGNVTNYTVLYKKLQELSLVPIKMEYIPGDVKGYYNPNTKEIVIQEGMSEIQTIKTLIHELAHSLLHDKRNPSHTLSAAETRAASEIEAESIAYTVCNYIGIDTSEYSFSYLASQSKDKKLEDLKKSLECIQITSGYIISTLINRTKENELTISKQENQIKKLKSKRR